MKSIHRPAFLLPLLVCAVALGYLAGDVRSEDEKPKEKKGAAAKADAPFVQVASGPAKLKEGHRNAIQVKLGKALTATGNVGTSGNLSVRTESGLLITPSGLPYAQLEPDQGLFSVSLLQFAHHLFEGGHHAILGLG